MEFRKVSDCYYISSKAKNDYERNDWIIFYWYFGFNISFEICGYFDNRPQINVNLFFFYLTIILPFRNKWTDECDPPRWGIAIHSNTFWIYTGGKGNTNGGTTWLTWEIPFFTKKWVRTSVMLNDYTWAHDTPANPKDFFEDNWKQKQKTFEYNYRDKSDGEIIPTTIHLREREWRPKWLTWTSLFATKIATIEVEFSKEVGKRKGSWKGGCIGCNYDLLPNETPLDCLMRMEKERIF